MTSSRKYNNLRKQTSSTWNRGATRCASLCPDKPPSVRPVANVARVAAAHRIFQDDVRHREPSEVLVAAFLDHLEAASHGRLFVRSSVQVLHHFLLPMCNTSQTSHMDLEWNHHATRGLGALRGLACQPSTLSLVALGILLQTPVDETSETLVVSGSSSFTSDAASSVRS